jgi:hypothetical protein
MLPRVMSKMTRTAPARKVRAGIVIFGAGALFAGLILLTAAFGSHAKPGARTHQAARAGSEPVQAASARTSNRLGQVVRDGDFAFVAKGLFCGSRAASAVTGGGPYGEIVPSGVLECIVILRVSDDTDTAQTFLDSNQYAYDKHGRQFSADGFGTTWLNGDQDGTLVKPGSTITAPVPFQIPAGDSITRLVLHDSLSSDGATVQL